MGIFERVSNAGGKLFNNNVNIVSSPTYAPQAPQIISETPKSFAANPLFGNRTRADEVAPEIELPIDDDTQRNSGIKDIASQLGQMLGIGNNKDVDMQEDSSKGLFSEKYLRSIAELKLAQLKIKYNFKISLIKIAFGKMLEAVGKVEKSKEVFSMQLTLNDMDDIIKEMIYLDLSHQNKMGTLKSMGPDEYFNGLMNVAFEKIGGEGFENYIDLATAGFDKAKTLMKPKPQNEPNG